MSHPQFIRSFLFVKSSAAFGCPRLSNFYSLCLPPLTDVLVSCQVTWAFSISNLPPGPYPSSTPLPPSRSALALRPACGFQSDEGKPSGTSQWMGRRQPGSLRQSDLMLELPHPAARAEVPPLAFSAWLGRWGLTVPQLSGEGRAGTVMVSSPF